MKLRPEDGDIALAESGRGVGEAVAEGGGEGRGRINDHSGVGYLRSVRW